MPADSSLFPYFIYFCSEMKPDYNIHGILRPLGWIYGAVTALRNRRFDRGCAHSSVFPVPVISVGNITAGGTGKTPHTEYIAALIKDKYPTAILSRGYGRSTKGYILADASATGRTIGDEPLQMHRRFPDVDLAVCENRAQGIERLISERDPQVILLDDAFQHRRVTPSLNILLVNYNRNIMTDAMLPAGRLRESAKGRSRAHIIIVTKCPRDLSPESMDELASNLAVTPAQQVFFSTLDYGTLYPYIESAAVPSTTCPVLAVTGIADPAPMTAELRTTHSDVKLLSYPDHHSFTKRNIKEIAGWLQTMPASTIIVTTAKDAARLSDLQLPAELSSRLYVLPVKPAFIRDAELFDSTIINHIESFRKQ